jgi:hypothetical protein
VGETFGPAQIPQLTNSLKRDAKGVPTALEMAYTWQPTIHGVSIFEPQDLR